MSFRSLLSQALPAMPLPEAKPYLPTCVLGPISSPLDACIPDIFSLSPTKFPECKCAHLNSGSPTVTAATTTPPTSEEGTSTIQSFSQGLVSCPQCSPSLPENPVCSVLKTIQNLITSYHFFGPHGSLTLKPLSWKMLVTQLPVSPHLGKLLPRLPYKTEIRSDPCSTQTPLTMALSSLLH